MAKAAVIVGQLMVAKVVIAPTESDGPPTTVETEATKCHPVATFENRTVVWVLPTGAIRADQRLGDVDGNAVVMARHRVETAEAEWRELVSYKRRIWNPA